MKNMHFSWAKKEKLPEEPGRTEDGSSSAPIFETKKRKVESILLEFNDRKWREVIRKTGLFFFVVNLLITLAFSLPPALYYIVKKAHFMSV